VTTELTTLYRLSQVSKTFDNLFALENINLEIDQNEVLGIIGHSGAGKTTLLRLLAGLEYPTKGILEFKGRKIKRETRKFLRKQVTMLFQTPLFLRGSVYSNLEYALRLMKVPESERSFRVNKALERIRLEHFRERNARSLSGGEQKRVALARAILIDPLVLVLDEPTSNLDPINSRIMANIIEEEAKERCIIIATHDYSQIKLLTDRTVSLEYGKVNEVGITKDLLAFTKFTDNVFTGTSKQVNGITHVDIGGLIIMVASKLDKKPTIHVRPEDIIVSKNSIDTSARNQFKGKITSLRDHNSAVRIDVNVGKIISVQITRKSFKEMGLNIGSEIYISFKASSVINL
jgi:molybdopterin-binding protein